MYKVFLVDDEELVIKSLRASVDWNNYGFEVVGYSLNGNDAYEKINEIGVDVVFTDIRMPGNSGLELIKKIKKINVDTIFIVVSGYAEFAYAQKAMNYGALGYCLKPFDDDEIVHFLKKSKAILESKKPTEFIQLVDLIEENNKTAQAEIRRILSEFNLEISEINKMNILISLGKNKLDLSNCENILSLKIGYEKFAYFISEGDKLKINKNILANKDEVKGIGISKPIDDISLIKKAISEAEIKAYGYFSTNLHNDNAVNFTLSEDFHLVEQNNIIKKLNDAISRDDAPTIVKLLDEMTNLFEEEKLNIRHAIIIYNQVMSFANRLKNMQFEEFIYSYKDITSLFESAKDMLLYLKKILSEKLNTQYELYSQKVINHTFKSILIFINENFCCDISAQSIARDFNINTNYFSQLFKKELGIGFAEYLSKLRIDYACKLIKTDDVPISEIAEQIGYNDYFYFSRVFKKRMGKSPSAYRVDFLRL